ncbi:hypothetical protein COCON_G00091490 [Conger conger]|uniref:Uncharacterized protein n=1 Tax=Conger conger TaxID=82655 RepID=A0A9Q1DL51_CONCO|nr:hypothetical protein COCON_G00091490 [Conger conger]
MGPSKHGAASYSFQNSPTGLQNKDFPVRNGRAGKGSPKLPQTPKSQTASLQNSVRDGTFSFLSSVEYSRSESRASRIPVSKTRSAAVSRSVSVAESASVRVWKFIKPGMGRRPTLSDGAGAPKKEAPALQPTSMPLLKDTERGSLYLLTDVEA